VSPCLAWIGSPCLRRGAHGDPIGGGGGSGGLSLTSTSQNRWAFHRWSEQLDRCAPRCASPLSADRWVLADRWILLRASAQRVTPIPMSIGSPCLGVCTHRDPISRAQGGGEPAPRGAAPAVSHPLAFLACIGSPCLRRGVHGDPIAPAPRGCGTPATGTRATPPTPRRWRPAVPTAPRPIAGIIYMIVMIRTEAVAEIPLRLFSVHLRF
jgi:hypothetical protein